jgi:hypothetical protein
MFKTIKVSLYITIKSIDPSGDSIKVTSTIGFKTTTEDSKLILKAYSKGEGRLFRLNGEDLIGFECKPKEGIYDFYSRQVFEVKQQPKGLKFPFDNEKYNLEVELNSFGLDESQYKFHNLVKSRGLVDNRTDYSVSAQPIGDVKKIMDKVFVYSPKMIFQILSKRSLKATILKELLISSLIINANLISSFYNITDYVSGPLIGVLSLLIQLNNQDPLLKNNINIVDFSYVSNFIALISSIKLELLIVTIIYNFVSISFILYSFYDNLRLVPKFQLLYPKINEIKLEMAQPDEFLKYEKTQINNTYGEGEFLDLSFRYRMMVNNLFPFITDVP